jgi:hypothetical protein
MSPRARRLDSDSSWQKVLIGVVIGLLLSTFINDDEVSRNERLLMATSKALASRNLQQPCETSSDTNPIKDDGWHSIHVYYGDQKHLPFYSTINKEYFEQVQWFGQRQQDLVVSTLLRGKKNGYFIDLAANDAVRISNTYALEANLDWNGLCIEPNPEYWAGLAYRKCDIVGAVVSKTNKEELQFRYTENGQRSGIIGGNFENKGDKKKSKDVDLPRYGVKLEDIFSRFHTPTVIDYMSLDVEGAEEFVMENFPFDKYRFNILTVERDTEQLTSILEQNGYKLLKVLLSNHEFLWIHKGIESELDMSALEIDTDRYNYRERVDKIEASVKRD